MGQGTNWASEAVYHKKVNDHADEFGGVDVYLQEISDAMAEAQVNNGNVVNRQFLSGPDERPATISYLPRASTNNKHKYRVRIPRAKADRCLVVTHYWAVVTYHKVGKNVGCD